MPEETLHVLAFAGSLRRASYNRGLLRAAMETAPADVVVTMFNLSPIPPYCMDLEAGGGPEPVQELKAAIAAADALLIATPEHNYSFPGVLKNALDWVSRPANSSPFIGKPVAIVGASSGRFGTARAQAALRPVLASLDLLVMSKPELFVTQAEKVSDEDGNVVDQPTRDRVRDVVQALALWTRRLQTS